MCVQMSSNSLLSADYEGCVCLWDVGRGQGQSVVEFDAHERRIWSAAFCPMKATQFVSGSDDGWVKVLQCHLLPYHNTLVAGTLFGFADVMTYLLAFLWPLQRLGC